MTEADGPLPLAGVSQRRLQATATGDLTARGYCSFQVTKCGKKLTSVSQQIVLTLCF